MKNESVEKNSRWLRTTNQLIINYIKVKSKFLKKKICILISNDFSLTGAPIVLLEYAKVCKELGYLPVIVSEKRGPLEINLRREKIDYIVVKKNGYEQVCQLLEGEVKLVLVNTVVNYKWVEFFQTKKCQLYWWLHESEYFRPLFLKIIGHISKHVRILYVSERVKRCLLDICEGLENPQSVLMYGIKDEYKRELVGKKSKKKVFSIIGIIDQRKNQLEFIEAIQKLPQNIRKKAMFVIVGANGNKAYYAKVKNLSTKIKEIKLLDSIPHEKMEKLYSYTDCVISTSVDDPLPVVLAEAMMHKKMIISSKNTGFAECIADGVNGFVYQDVYQLSALIEKIILNQYDHIQIGENARRLFEETVHIKNFKKNVKSMLENL